MGIDFNHKRVRELLEEHSKMQLAIMLVECENKLAALSKQPSTIPVSEGLYVCRSWADCVNPHFDCINCPLRNSGNGGRTSVGTAVRPYC